MTSLMILLGFWFHMHHFCLLLKRLPFIMSISAFHIRFGCQSCIILTLCCCCWGLTLISTGVRYPASLLPEVVAMLSTAQSMVMPNAAIQQMGQLGQLTGEALQAASLGAGGAIRTEPVSPVQPKSLAKAFRWAMHQLCMTTALELAKVSCFALSEWLRKLDRHHWGDQSQRKRSISQFKRSWVATHPDSSQYLQYREDTTLAFGLTLSHGYYCCEPQLLRALIDAEHPKLSWISSSQSNRVTLQAPGQWTESMAK